jgi:hypothetical protein
LAICFIRHACGDPPPGYELEILWHEHDSGEYATVGITWDGPSEAPWDYISRAGDALERFDQAVAWSDLAPDLKESGDDDLRVGIADNDEEDNGQAECEVQEELSPPASRPPFQWISGAFTALPNSSEGAVSSLVSKVLSPMLRQTISAIPNLTSSFDFFSVSARSVHNIRCDLCIARVLHLDRNRHRESLPHGLSIELT